MTIIGEEKADRDSRMIATGKIRVSQRADKTLRSIKSTSFVFGREEARGRHALRIKNRILELHLSELSNRYQCPIEFTVAQAYFGRSMIILSLI